MLKINKSKLHKNIRKSKHTRARGAGRLSYRKSRRRKSRRRKSKLRKSKRGTKRVSGSAANSRGARGAGRLSYRKSKLRKSRRRKSKLRKSRRRKSRSRYTTLPLPKFLKYKI